MNLIPILIPIAIVAIGLFAATLAVRPPSRSIRKRATRNRLQLSPVHLFER